MAALQAKLDVANERITQLTDEAWGFFLHQRVGDDFDEKPEVWGEIAWSKTKWR